MRAAASALFAIGLIGCADLPDAVPVIVDVPAVEEPQVTPPGPESVALTRYYTRLQQRLLAQGLLRGGGGGPDTPFSANDLARNFVRIALFSEYSDDSDFLRPQVTISKLRRWDGPIRMAVGFGDSVPLAQRDMDLASVSAYAARLQRLTGVPIRITDQAPNFHVLFLNEADRRAHGPRLRLLMPTIPDATLRRIINLPREQLCLVIGSFDPEQASYDRAVAIIRAEHPSLMRAACIHEELAQGMGLANDSPGARPSIFNDDEEFALLTRHDELLLRMLYDPRLRTGMDPATAAPIARQIAQDITGLGGS